MKAVLLSIRPKWCELIASGKKTVEIRKTKPKIETPFKCYIYCTYGEGLIEAYDEFLPNYLIEQKVSKQKTWQNCCNGKVIGEFVCDCIRREREVVDGLVDIILEKTSCLSYRQLIKYADGRELFSWHISDLVIYEKPRPLSDFRKSGVDRVSPLERPPQSWCYVEEV